MVWLRADMLSLQPKSPYFHDTLSSTDLGWERQLQRKPFNSTSEGMHAHYKGFLNQIRGISGDEGEGDEGGGNGGGIGSETYASGYPAPDSQSRLFSASAEESFGAFALSGDTDEGFFPVSNRLNCNRYGSRFPHAVQQPRERMACILVCVEVTLGSLGRRHASFSWRDCTAVLTCDMLVHLRDVAALATR